MKHGSELADLRDDDEETIGVFGDEELGVRAVDDVRALTGTRWEHRERFEGRCEAGKKMNARDVKARARAITITTGLRRRRRRR